MLAAGRRRAPIRRRRSQKKNRVFLNPLAVPFFGVFHLVHIDLEQNTRAGEGVQDRPLVALLFFFFYAQPFTHRGGFKEVGVLGHAALLKASGDPQLSLLD